MNEERKDILSFYELSEKNFKEVIGSSSEIVSKVKAIDDVFDTLIDNISTDEFLLQPFFLVRSHSLFRSSARIGLGGQLPDAYVLLRAVLENALYAWYLARHPDLNKVWLSRMDGGTQKKQMKKNFQFKPILTALSEEDKLIGEKISTLYDSLIDFGAHPNAFGVIGGTEILRSKKGLHINLQYLYGNGDFFKLFLKDLPRVGIGAFYYMKKYIYQNLKY